MNLKKWLIGIMMPVCILTLTGCSSIDTPFLDSILEAFNFPINGDFEGMEKVEDDKSEEKGEEPPVIIVENDDEPVIQTSEFEATVEIPEETEEQKEFVWDDEAKLYYKETKNSDSVKLDFIGDVSFSDGYANMNMLRGIGDGIYGVISEEVITEMQDADIFMMNNEFPYSDRGAPREGKKFTFRAQPDTVSYLSDMGVDIVSLANNHAYDYGPDALTDTVDLLYENRIPFVGAGKNYEEAAKPVYFKVNGKIISYVSATQIERIASPDTKEATEDSPGVIRTLDSTKFVEIIKKARENSDFVVVYVHWGSESTDLVEDSQRALAKDYVSAGASLIVGDHSHCLQGLDYVEGVPVIYSLGNFWFNSKTVDTGIFSVVLDTAAEDGVKVSSMKFIPCIQKSCKTSMASADDCARIFQYLQGISNYAIVDENGGITKSEEDMNTQNGVNTCPNRVSTSTEEDAAPSDEELLKQLLEQAGAEQTQ